MAKQKKSNAVKEVAEELASDIQEQNPSSEVEVIEVSENEMQQLKDAMAEMQEIKQQQLEKFSSAISGYRQEAIDGRRMSGIEDIWEEDEDAYAGVDDANRDEEVGHKNEKVSLESAFNNKYKAKKIKSTVFLNITRPYVDAASARTGDMLLPNDEKNWAIKQTPIPEVVEKAQAGELGPEHQQMTTNIVNTMQNKLKDVETQIDDWLIETDYSREVRKVIEDCSRVGTGVLKGPFPEYRKTRAGNEIKPASKYVDYRCLYPDPNCGEDIQNGKYLFEKDTLTAKRVRELIKQPDYMQDQIEEVLKEGPGKRLIEDDTLPLDDSEIYEVWYFHGIISKNDLELCGCDGMESDVDMIPAVATLINDRVIHVNEYPIDNEDFPYDVITWQRRKDHWAGIGIARQMRTPQRMLNASTRAMMDNAGISSGPQIIYRRDVIKPEDGNYELAPNKRWYAEDDMDIQDVANAFITIDIPSLQGPLNEIIMFALKMAEDVTGMPMLMQGSQGNAPDTVGGMKILNNNANVVLRRIARSFDSNITIPHIQRYYDWLILHKGVETDYQVEARGSSTLVERDIQNQAILQMGQMVLNPAFGVKPDLWMQEYLKSLKFDPKRFQDDESGKPDMEKQQMGMQIQQMQQELATRQQEKEAELEFKYAELQNEKEIAMMRLAMDRDMKLEELKAKLGLEAQKAQTDTAKTQQDTQLRAIEGKIKAHEAQTRRISEENKVNELNYKASTGKDGI